MEPTVSVGEKGGTLTIDGLAFDFLDAAGTEAPSEFVFYLPAYKALHTTEVVTHNLHNILTLRGAQVRDALRWRSEEHTSELQSLMRISYAVFCLKKNKNH